ncbi:hypothetical protein HNR34_000076 [Geobacillus subterraneus]
MPGRLFGWRSHAHAQRWQPRLGEDRRAWLKRRSPACWPPEKAAVARRKLSELNPLSSNGIA